MGENDGNSFVFYLQTGPPRVFEEVFLKIALAIFTKTPELSGVKTRLAKDLGEIKAREFFERSLKVTDQLTGVLSEKTPLDIYWSVAEREALEHVRWKDKSLIYQGAGTLGDRLQTYDKVCFMGADSPHLDPIYLGQILRDRSDFILGPTLDGGFYFFSGSLRIPKEFWKGVPYSSHDTCEKLKSVLQKLGHVSEGKTDFDIDDIEDLKKLAKGDIPLTLNSQKELQVFSQNLLT